MQSGDVTQSHPVLAGYASNQIVWFCILTKEKGRCNVEWTICVLQHRSIHCLSSAGLSAISISVAIMHIPQLLERARFDLQTGTIIPKVLELCDELVPVRVEERLTTGVRTELGAGIVERGDDLSIGGIAREVFAYGVSEV